MRDERVRGGAPRWTQRAVPADDFPRAMSHASCGASGRGRPTKRCEAGARSTGPLEDHRRAAKAATNGAPGSRKWGRHTPPLLRPWLPATARRADGPPGGRVVPSATARSCGRSSRRRSPSPRGSAPSTGRGRQPRHRSRSQPSAAFDGPLATRESCCVRGCGGCDSSDDVHGEPGARREVVGHRECRMPPIATRGRGGRMRDERVGGGALRSTQREDLAVDSPRAVSPSSPRRDPLTDSHPTGRSRDDKRPPERPLVIFVTVGTTHFQFESGSSLRSRPSTPAMSSSYSVGRPGFRWAVPA